MEHKDPREGLGGLLSRIEALTQALNTDTDPQRVLRHIVTSVCENSDWSMSSIMALDRAKGLSHLVVENNPLRGVTDGLADRWPLDSSPVGEASMTGKPKIIEDALSTEIYADYRKDAELWGYRTVVILPLNCSLADGRPLVLSVQSPDRKAVGSVELSILSTFAKLASIAIEKANRINAESQMVSRLSKAAKAHVELMSLVLLGEALEPVTEVIARMLQQTVVIVDLTTNSIAAANPSKLISVARSDGSTRLLRQLRAAPPSALGAQMAIQLTLPEIGSGAGTAYHLVAQAEAIGALVLIDESDVEDRIDALVLQEAFFATSALLMTSAALFRARAETKSDLFSSLFTGNWRNRDSVLARANALGVDLAGQSLLLALEVDGPKDVAEKHEYQTLTRSIAKLAPDVHVIRDLSLYVIIVPCREDGQSIMPVWIDQLFRDLKWMRSTDATLAKSRPCRELEDYYPARKEIEEALRLARVFKRTGLVQAADFGSHGLLLSVAGQANIDDFIERAVGAIIRYDEANSTDLLQTAISYIESGCRLTACAERLQIHITTLRYRIARLKEPLGIDLQDPKKRFDLELAVRLLELSDTKHPNFMA